MHRLPSAVAAVIHATSDQALHQQQQSDEASCDDQQRQGSSCVLGVESYSAHDRAILGLLVPSHVLMQLLLAVVVPMVLLVGLTALLASGRLVLSRNAQWLLARQNTIWMAGIVALAAAAMVVALQR